MKKKTYTQLKKYNIVYLLLFCIKLLQPKLIVTNNSLEYSWSSKNPPIFDIGFFS